VTDEALQALRETGLLHALWLASNPSYWRPRNDSEVAGLDLKDTRVTDAGLKDLADLKGLQTLLLDKWQLTDAAVRTLREIGLFHALTQAEADDHKRPSNPSEVKALDLAYAGVTDEGMKTLAGLKGLETLDLSYTQVTDGGLKELAGLKGLKTLALFNCKGVTDAGVAELQKALPDCKITR
jgi:hypothetical protein